MRYGSPYKIIEFDARALQKINRAINSNEMGWEKGVVPEAKGRILRKSEVTWINDERVDNSSSFLNFKKGLNNLIP